MKNPAERSTRDPFEKDMLNYYEILDIQPDASASDVRQAYFRAKSAYGKDSNAVYSLFDAQESKSVLERIEEAYLVLSDVDRRKEYDKTHGFLRPGNEIQMTKKSTAKNIFSFSTGESVRPQIHQDPAQQAARAVFGAEAMGEERPTLSPPKIIRDSPTTPPAEDYRVKDPQSRLGIVRRMELTKPFQQDTGMEQQISAETEFHGEFLKKVREYRCITMDELSEFTKISKTYLNCLENEEYDSLPAPPYVRGFVSQVAKSLKLPHDKAAAGYMKRYYSVKGDKQP